MADQVIVQLVPCQQSARFYAHFGAFHTGAVLQDKPEQCFRHDDLIQASNVWVQELPMVVDFSSEVRIVLLGRLKHNLFFLSEEAPIRALKCTLEPFVSLWVAR